MSLSKETVTAMDESRHPKCTRCRHHGIVVQKKGHVRSCPFLKCACWKCYLITQRTQIAALQRNLKKTQSTPHVKEQRPCAPTGVSERKPAAEPAPSALDTYREAHPSAASRRGCPQFAGHTGSAATAARSPVDPRSRPAEGGEREAGLERKEVLPFTSSGEGPSSPFNAPYFSETEQTPPLPLINFPFRVSGHYPSSYAPCPSFLFNMPWLPPAPADYYSTGLCVPQMFPCFQPGPVHYPPPPEPGPVADYKMIYFTRQPPPLPEAFQQHPQPPPPKHNELDVEEVD